jgi:hypothetical protein
MLITSWVYTDMSERKSPTEIWDGEWFVPEISESHPLELIHLPMILISSFLIDISKIKSGAMFQTESIIHGEKVAERSAEIGYPWIAPSVWITETFRILDYCQSRSTVKTTDLLSRTTFCPRALIIHWFKICLNYQRSIFCWSQIHIWYDLY